MGLLSSNPDILGHFNCCSKEISWCTETLHHRWWGWGGKESQDQLLSNKQKMTAIGQLQAELQPHKRRHSKTKFTASYGRLGSNGLRKTMNKKNPVSSLTATEKQCKGVWGHPTRPQQQQVQGYNLRDSRETGTECLPAE